MLPGLTDVRSCRSEWIANMLGQTEDYKKYGVDEETPSGVEDIRNSTQRTGMSLNLVLSDVSSIGGSHSRHRRQHSCWWTEETRGRQLEEGTNQESQATFLHEDVENETNDEDGEIENDDTEDMHFTCMDTTGRNHKNERNPKSKTMKAKPCGFSFLLQL